MKTAPREQVAITVLSQKGESALVEWHAHSGVQRATVPVGALHSLQDGSVEIAREILEQGIPYGEAWDLLPIGRIGAEQIAAELHRRGIWTAEDAHTKVHVVRAALAQLYARDLETILNVARARGNA